MKSLPLLLLLLFAIIMPVSAAEKIAWVIGNDRYRDHPLKNPVRDATAIAEALKRIGFEVILSKNASLNSMHRSLDNFGKRAATAKVAIIYYAGHGIQNGDKNYLVPTNITLQHDQDLRPRKLISLDSLITEASQASIMGVVMVDASRDNPFQSVFQLNLETEEAAKSGQPQVNAGNGAQQVPGGGRTRSLRGLARVTTRPINASKRILVSLATQQGQVAFDGGGKHSPYAEAILEYIEKPVGIRQIMEQVKNRVAGRTRHRQVPYLYTTLDERGTYCLTSGCHGKSNPALDERPSRNFTKQEFVLREQRKRLEAKQEEDRKRQEYERKKWEAKQALKMKQIRENKRRQERIRKQQQKKRKQLEKNRKRAHELEMNKRLQSQRPKKTLKERLLQSGKAELAKGANKEVGVDSESHRKKVLMDNKYEQKYKGQFERERTVNLLVEQIHANQHLQKKLELNEEAFKAKLLKVEATNTFLEQKIDENNIILKKIQSAQQRSALRRKGRNEDAILLEMKRKQDQIDKMVNGAEDGKYLFSTPKSMKLHHTSSVSLFLGTKMPGTINQTTNNNAQTSNILANEVKISTRMEAQLTGQNFKIMLTTPVEQLISKSRATEWKWQVEPTSSGQQQLYLTITAIFEVDGNSYRHVVQTQTVLISVDSSIPSTVYTFIGSHWQWIWTMILVPLGLFLWKMRKQPPKKVHTPVSERIKNRKANHI